MHLWIRQTGAIARNAFSVLLGDPFTLILQLCLVIGAAVIAHLPAFTFFGEHLRLLRDQTLAMTFMGGALAATLGAAKVVGEEGRKGMTPLIMSRPVSPACFLGGKWLGLSGALLLLAFSATVAYLWASRIVHFQHHIERLGTWAFAAAVALPLAGAGLSHFRHRGCFVRKANLALLGSLLAGLLILGFCGWEGDTQEHYGALVDWPAALAYLYLLLALLTYAAILVALAVSADLSLLMAASAIVFFVGLLAEYLLATFVPLTALADLLRLLVPNWQAYWIAERLADSGPPPPLHLLAATIHALGQAILYLLAGQWWMRRHEMDGGI